MLYCLAIDDEPLALKKIAGYIEKTPFLEAVALCESAFEAMEVLEKERVDLLFVDINMPDLSGMEFVKSLVQKPEVIFTTAYSEYAVEGFKVDALDYLLKPFGYDEFLRAANKAKMRLQPREESPEQLALKDQHLFLKSGHKIVRLKLADITYIESQSEYCRIHRTGGKPVMTLISLKKLEEVLPADRFMRVHRSFIVHLARINTIEGNRITCGDEKAIPVSEQYREALKKYIDQFFL